MTHYTNTDNPIDFPKSALKHAKGNLIDMAENGDFDIIVQGCNCFNTMGGGIAREIRERYPHVAAVDGKTRRGDYNKLGTWTSENVILKNGTITFDIINAYTQYNMSQGTDVFEYTAFQLILEKLVHAYGTKRIGFPYIGMGLAGGDSAYIIAQIEAFAEEVSAKGGTVTLVEFG
jgi:O-acetyl-ADP-ribose deacetylase (regulator of RNase III)